MIIGLFVSIEDFNIRLVDKGVMQAAKTHGASVIIYGVSTERVHGFLDEKSATRFFSFDPAKHDGVIMAFSGKPLQDYARKLWSKGFPTMLIARSTGDVPCVINNNRETFRLIVHNLVEKGHHQIAFVSGPANVYSAQERFLGYQQGLRECGIEFDPSLVIDGDYTDQTALQNLNIALAKGWRCTALIGANDRGAIGAMEALRTAGLSPGADVEVVGFDNIPQANWSKPSLSTYDSQTYQMGYQATVELVKCIRKEPFEPCIIVPASFVPRKSTWETSTEADPEQPLAADWRANQFLYEVQLASLRSDTHGKNLMESLRGSTDTPESFLQTFRELIDETTNQGFDVLCLFPVLTELGNVGLEDSTALHTPFALRSLLDEAFAVLSVAVFDAQKRLTETTLRYGNATVPLRELSSSASKEDDVIATFRSTLRDLHIERAGVFLLDTQAKHANEERKAGRWYAWSSARGEVWATRQPVAVSHFDFTSLLPGYRSSTWMYLPLLHDTEILGTVVLDASNEFLVHYPDLIRLFAVSLHATRMHAALMRANADLVETSRLAGLAEMATGVLHNIGNALNSVNTSCSLTTELVRKSRVTSVTKAAQMLRDHREDLAEFLTKDPRGLQLPAYLSQLAGHLQDEQVSLLKELETLRSMVDHINQIVAAQQTYAHVSGPSELISPTVLVEMAMRLCEASIIRHGVTVSRLFSDTSPVLVQRQKAIQILVNLIQNAKEAMSEGGAGDKLLTLHIGPASEGRVAITITDNGIGIPAENLLRIFSFGFTTKEGGHGFGLHNGALAAKEMGGNLTGGSKGTGLGASFVLELQTEG
jgi:DNA-binding LacI/PurR family transcriptional regulator/C4-dicarboxylate-specific signal transduction histidine kinase